MAARNATHMNYTMNREQVTLTGKCVGNAAASPTALKGIGIASVVFVSTGKYTLNLQDKYAALLLFKYGVIDSSATKHFNVTVSAVTTNAAGKTALTLEVFSGTTTVAPTRANLVSTETLCFELTMSNTVQVPNGN